MKLTVRITGVLEAELELPEATVSTLGVTNWSNWHNNQYVEATSFIRACADEAQKIIKQQQHFLEQ